MFSPWFFVQIESDERPGVVFDMRRQFQCFLSVVASKHAGSRLKNEATTPNVDHAILVGFI